MSYMTIKELYDIEGLSFQLHENNNVERFIGVFGKYYIQLHIPIKDIGYYYFKVYDNSDVYLSTKIARISIISPEYICCDDCSKYSWELSNSEIADIISILSSQYENDCTVWEYIKESFIEEGEQACSIKYPSILIDSTMPDYTRL